MEGELWYGGVEGGVGLGCFLGLGLCISFLLREWSDQYQLLKFCEYYTSDYFWMWEN